MSNLSIEELLTKLHEYYADMLKGKCMRWAEIEAVEYAILVKFKQKIIFDKEDCK